MARALAEAGAKIILNGQNPETLATAAKEFSAAGYEVMTLPFDVRNEASVVNAFATLDEQNITVDILVNNAGIQHRQPMVELSSADWQKVLDTNLTSAFLVGREAAKRMIQRGQGGKIVNIGSLTSDLARATVAPYTAAKGGIKLLTKSMAAEWAKFNIQANAHRPRLYADRNDPIPGRRSHLRRLGQRAYPGRALGTPRRSDGNRHLPEFCSIGLCQRTDSLCRRRDEFGVVNTR